MKVKVTGKEVIEIPVQQNDKELEPVKQFTYVGEYRHK